MKYLVLFIIFLSLLSCSVDPGTNPGGTNPVVGNSLTYVDSYSSLYNATVNGTLTLTVASDANFIRAEVSVYNDATAKFEYREADFYDGVNQIWGSWKTIGFGNVTYDGIVIPCSAGQIQIRVTGINPTLSLNQRGYWKNGSQVLSSGATQNLTLTGSQTFQLTAGTVHDVCAVRFSNTSAQNLTLYYQAESFLAGGQVWVPCGYVVAGSTGITYFVRSSGGVVTMKTNASGSVSVQAWLMNTY
jgi:hypothetical protein